MHFRFDIEQKLKRKQKKEDTKKQQKTGASKPAASKPQATAAADSSADPLTTGSRSRDRKAAIESAKDSKKRSAIEELKAKRHARKAQGRYS